MTLLGFHIEHNTAREMSHCVMSLRGLMMGKSCTYVAFFFLFFLLLQSGSQPLLLQGSVPRHITLYRVNIYDLIVTYDHIRSTLCHNLHL